MFGRNRNYRKLSPKTRLLRERANMSFFIVVMFFAIFGIIVLTEIFLIDERGRGAGVIVGHSSGYSGNRQRGNIDRPDYEDVQSILQGEDYLVYRGAGFDESLGMFVRENRGMSHSGPRSGNAQDIMPQQDFLKAIPEVQLPPGKNVPPDIESKLPGPVNITAKDGMWQTVSGTRYKFFVFSAFYDRRDERTIRIVGATKTRSPERVFCRFWYTGNSTAGTNNYSVSVSAKVKIIRENWNLKYSACFVLCPLSNNVSVPYSVSVVSLLRLPPTNHLLVLNSDRDPEVRNGTVGVPEKFAVCVKPLHFNYNKVVHMLEFLELYSILGVRHFTFYNHSIDPGVGCVLQDYIDRGIVSLYPWQLNMVSQKEIRTEGLFAALNDCLYRSMYRYSHVALIDLDEYIIPRHNDTLPQLMEWMSSKGNTKHIGSFSFQNAFFYLQWADDQNVAISNDKFEKELVTLCKTRRKTKLHPHKQRSKYICRPEYVVEAGNHFVWEFVPAHGTLNIPPDAAILHHYRVCEFGGDDCVKTASTVDRTAHRYRDKLVKRVSWQWEDLKERCMLPELPQNAMTTPISTSNQTKTKGTTLHS